MFSNKIVELYDNLGNPVGVFINSELWKEIRDDVLKKINLETKSLHKEIKEPLEDWEMFKRCWDFKYPYDFSVKCKICGNETKNWEKDPQRKFFLTAANVSGLVSFRCTNCNARIVKKHFKDKIITECIPYSKK